MMNELMLSWRRIWTIARRELKSMFDHPTGYVLLIVFVAINDFMFFRQAYLVGVASLRSMIDLLPWILLFFVPAVSMRTLAEDTRSGMLEVVLTQPLNEGELLIGKFLGALLFLGVGLAATLLIPITLEAGAHVYWGPIVAQYIGAVLLCAGLTGVGVWASTLARSQITAFILGVAVMFVLVLIGLDPLLVGLGPTAGAIAARLGVLSHFESIGRGVIDLRDVIYFLSLAGVFLALAYGALVHRRLARGGEADQRLRLGVVAIAAILVVVNLMGSYIAGRLDLTPGRAYTLSPATKQLLGGLGDIVTIKVFASDELPTSAALLKRELDDMLRDVRSAGHGKVRIVRKNPAVDSAAKRDAQSLGIGPVQFNVIGQSELQVKEGYLGLAIQYGSGSESIPFINRTDDLEYRLDAAIRGLTHPKKPAIGMVTDLVSPEMQQQQQGTGLELLRSELAKTYDVRGISLSDSTQPSADLSTIVLVGPSDAPLPAGSVERLKAFFRRGGTALVATSGTNLAPQMPLATPHQVPWNQFLQPFGVSVRSDVVYDLMSSDVVPVPTSFGIRVLQRYPFFVRAQSTAESVINKDLNDVLTPWPSSIDTAGAAKAGYTVTPLLESSKGSGASTDPTMIDPSRSEFPRTGLAPRLLAVQVSPKSAKDAAARGRLILVGASDFANSDFAQHSPSNLSFALNAVDWLSQDEALIAIRSKNVTPPALAFRSAVVREAVKYVNVIGVPVLLALAGIIHLAQRRRRTRLPYEPRLAMAAAGANA